MTKKQKRYLYLKRLCDILLAIILGVALLPIMIIAAIWIKCESKGPVIFRQKRPGKNKEIFTLNKFRSMRVETTVDGRALTDQERLTVSGKVLRKTSIDELPQIWNVLKGDMSFIGPRPFLINDLELYTEEQLIRFNVLPGISSWTAVNGRNNLSYEDKFNLEIYYVKNIGLKLDIIIFFKTIWIVLSGKEVDDIDQNNAPRIAAYIIEEGNNQSISD